MNNFKFNDCGVCINEEHLYQYKIAAALAWAYVEVSICEYQGKWSYGYWTLGGASPTTKNSAKYTRSEAIDLAIEQVKSSFERSPEGIGISKLIFDKYKNHFNYWVNKRKLSNSPILLPSEMEIRQFTKSPAQLSMF